VRPSVHFYQKRLYRAASLSERCNIPQTEVQTLLTFMVSKTPVFRKICIFSSAVLLGMGAFTYTYAAVYYSPQYCVSGRQYTAKSFVSQADADQKMNNHMAANPGDSNLGACTTPPSTPGA
jgi:hypothetical protein